MFLLISISWYCFSFDVKLIPMSCSFANSTQRNREVPCISIPLQLHILYLLRLFHDKDIIRLEWFWTSSSFRVTTMLLLSCLHGSRTWIVAIFYSDHGLYSQHSYAPFSTSCAVSQTWEDFPEIGIRILEEERGHTRIVQHTDVFVTFALLNFFDHMKFVLLQTCFEHWS